MYYIVAVRYFVVIYFFFFKQKTAYEMRISDWSSDVCSSDLLELDRGRGIPFEGNYTKWLEGKAKRMEQAEREEEGRQKAIKEELEWIRQSPRARQSKSKARIKAFDELVDRQNDSRPGSAQILIQVPERLGGTAIEAKKLSTAYGDTLLVANLSFSLPPGGMVGGNGANGAGKTPLR